MIRARLAALALAAGAGTAVLVGCGIDTQKAGKPSIAAPAGTATTGAQTTNTTAAKKLPKRPSGVVAVEGPRQGSLTPLAINNVQGVQVSFANTGETGGFADLCAGRIDVLDTSRLITRGEVQTCKRNGVELTDHPIQVASDAVVIATRNEADVGGDCLRLSTVKDIFRSGSAISNWSQVGFFDLSLHVTGRESTSPVFQFFAQTVLDVPSNASLADVRSDYILHTTDQGVLDEVTNGARRRAIINQYAPRVRDLVLQRQIDFQAHVDRAINAARARVLAQIDRENKRRAAQRITLSATQKILISRNNARRVNAATRAAQARAEGNFTFPQLTFLQRRINARLRRLNVPGTIGIFRFSYYEQFENRLRPMEIWDPVTEARVLGDSNVPIVSTVPATLTTTTGNTATVTQTTTTQTTTTQTTATSPSYPVVDPSVTPWCVFPSQTTITNGSYPLARPFLLYVSKLNVKRPEVRRFLTSYLNGAQSLATTNRLVPVPDTVLEQDRATVNGTTVPIETTTTSTTPTTSTTSTTATTPQAQQVPGVSSGGTSTGP